MLQDINESDSPFGSKVVVFGGDFFRQVLPVVPRATRQEQIDAIWLHHVYGLYLKK